MIVNHQGTEFSINPPIDQNIQKRWQKTYGYLEPNPEIEKAVEKAWGDTREIHLDYGHPQFQLNTATNGTIVTSEGGSPFTYQMTKVDPESPNNFPIEVSFNLGDGVEIRNLAVETTRHLPPQVGLSETDHKHARAVIQQKYFTEPHWGLLPRGTFNFNPTRGYAFINGNPRLVFEDLQSKKIIPQIKRLYPPVSVSPEKPSSPIQNINSIVTKFLTHPLDH